MLTLIDGTERTVAQLEECKIKLLRATTVYILDHVYLSTSRINILLLISIKLLVHSMLFTRNVLHRLNSRKYSQLLSTVTMLCYLWHRDHQSRMKLM